MIIQREVTILPQVVASDPDDYEVSLGLGILTRVLFIPPPGPNWEVYARVLHFENSIIPDIADEWIPMEKDVLEFFPNYDNWNGIYSIHLQVCSPQARYSHTIQFMFELQEKETSDKLLQDVLKMGL